MKHRILAGLLVLVLLCGGCAPAGTEEPSSRESSTGTAEEPAPPETDPVSQAEQTAREEILLEEIRSFEMALGGVPYERGAEGFRGWNFGATYLDEHGDGGLETEERNALISRMSEVWFDSPGETAFRYGDTTLYWNVRVKLQDIQVEGDQAVVTVSRTQGGEPLYDARYTFSARPAPEDLLGTPAEELVDNGQIWAFERVEWLGNDHAGEYTELSTAEDLTGLARRINEGDIEAAHGNYRLACDIDLTGVDWEPIGTQLPEDNGRLYGMVESVGFQGVLDGAGHRITGLDLNTEAPRAGFFGTIGPNAVVRDLTVEGRVQSSWADPNVPAGTSSVGGFAAVIFEGARVENCHFSGTVDGFSYTGGFVGQVEWDPSTVFLNLPEPTLEGCSFQGDVTGTSTSGGFAGTVSGWIQDCSAQGTLTVRPGNGFLAVDIGGFAGCVDKRLADCACGVKTTYVYRDPYRMGNFVGIMSGGGLTGCTMSEDCVNPDWYMVGYQEMLNLPMEVKLV